MEVIYKRERGHNYILFPGKGEAGSQTEMIRRNQIPGMASFYTEWEDNRRYYGYDITGAKPLGQMLEVRAFTRKETERLVEELAGILRGMEPFLLDRDKLVLRPELLYAYVDRHGRICMDRQGFLFFFCEEQEGSCQEHLRELVLYLFEKADGEDRELMELLFRIYRLLARGEPESEELLECLGREPQREAGLQEYPDLVAEERLEDRYGSDVQEEEGRSKRWRAKKRLFMGRREALAKFLGRRRLPLEEMWDDLEPARVSGRNEEPPSYAGRVSEERIDGEWESADHGTDHPTEILYTEESGGVPSLTEREGKEKIPLGHFPFYIGTQPGLDYCPKFHGVSRLHLKLEWREGHVWLTDLNSTNGTALNGEPLKPNEERRLEDGDRLWLAGLVYEFDSRSESW